MNLEPLLNAIKEDYNQWNARSPYGDDIRKAEREAEFAAGVVVEEGRKYIKVIQGNSVWGFIMKADDKKFRAGDILKAASWSAPARNKPRGNVIDGDLSWVRWTGPEYL
tara:strand:- start:213 stop:539 length:327 start_codon:yes stop_codon:yes gene_type:complete